jgi:hypothetical protein
MERPLLLVELGAECGDVGQGGSVVAWRLGERTRMSFQVGLEILDGPPDRGFVFRETRGVRVVAIHRAIDLPSALPERRREPRSLYWQEKLDDVTQALINFA